MPASLKKLLRSWRRSFLKAVLVSAVNLLLARHLAYAQDLEPRAYSAAPVGLNFLAAGFSDSTGDVSLDPSLPITGLKANIDSYTLGYERTFGVLGRSASFGIVVPELHGDLSGQVLGAGDRVSRTGIGDVRMRLAVNLFGGPALTPVEFADRRRSTALGTSVIVIMPTGQYNPEHLINVGSNRWAIKPEIGLSQPLGKFFVEAYTGVWLYSNNNDYFNGHKRSQNAIYTLQLHGGYNFRPNLWLAADVTYYTGGRTAIDGAFGEDQQSALRYGLTLSVPLVSTMSAKLAWSSSLHEGSGGNYQTFGVTLQYFWRGGRIAKIN